MSLRGWAGVRASAGGGGVLLFLVAVGVCDPGVDAQGAEATGLRVERITLPRASTTGIGDRMLTLVRVDLSRFRIRVIAASRDGHPRTLPAWLRDMNLAGGINAGMFLPNRRPVGTLIDNGVVISDRNPRRFDAMVGWNPHRASGPPIGIGGHRCPESLPATRRRFRSVVQGYRMMIDCRGRAIRWPNRRRYSAAAFGADADGNAVFLHVRTPYRMNTLNRMIADLPLRIRGLVYMEGGPEASLVVRGSTNVSEIGSWEDGFNENDRNHRFWEIPNVIGFSAR